MVDVTLINTPSRNERNRERSDPKQREKRAEHSLLHASVGTKRKSVTPAHLRENKQITPKMLHVACYFAAILIKEFIHEFAMKAFVQVRD